jgi:hypothetical protein
VRYWGVLALAGVAGAQVYIAGGFARRWIVGDLEGNYDLDVYGHTYADQERFVRVLRKLALSVHYSKHDLGASNFVLPGLGKVGVNYSLGEPEVVVRGMDLTPCMVYMQGWWPCVQGPGYFDAISFQGRVMNTHLGTWARILRYQGLGYQVRWSNDQHLEMAAHDEAGMS